MTGQWLVPFVRSPSPAVGIVCFPWAGGGAAGFHPFQGYVGEDVSLWSVALPGRQHRLSERREANLDRWVEAIGQEVVRLSDRPLVLFGHSFGALMAFEVAHWLKEGGHDMVKLVCVSSRRAPDVPSRLPHLASASDAQLVALMRGLGGAPEELLACEEMRDVVLPSLRDDLTLDAAYQPWQRRPLDMPLLGLAGRDDPLVDVADVNGWVNWTTRGFELSVLPGGHFYLKDRWSSVIKLIRQAIGGNREQVERTDAA